MSTDTLRNKLSQKALRLRQALLSQLAADMRERNAAVTATCATVSSALMRDPKSPEELDEVRAYADGCPAELEKVAAELAAVNSIYSVLDDERFALEIDDVSLFWSCAAEPARLQRTLEQCRDHMAASQDSFLASLRQDQATLAAEVSAIAAEVEAFSELGDISKTDERMQAVYDVEERLARAQQQADLFSAREEIFGAKQTEMPEIAAAAKAFEASAFLWRTASELAAQLPMWMDGPFGALNPDQIASDVDKWARGTMKVYRQLKQGGPSSVADKVKERVEEFQANLPLIVALRNPGMRRRHWERLGATVGFEVDPGQGFSLARALDLGLPTHIAAVEEVGEVAAKEFGLERTLDKMQGDWQGCVLAFTEWRETKTFILKGLDEIQARAHCAAAAAARALRCCCTALLQPRGLGLNPKSCREHYPPQPMRCCCCCCHRSPAPQWTLWISAAPRPAAAYACPFPACSPPLCADASRRSDRQDAEHARVAVHRPLRGARAPLGAQAEPHAGDPRRLARLPAGVALPRANLRLRRHPAADARGGPQVQGCRRAVAPHHGEVPEEPGRVTRLPG